MRLVTAFTADVFVMSAVITTIAFKLSEARAHRSNLTRLTRNRDWRAQR